uniref:DNA 3'-5' helicase n=1 Tax=Stylonychia lemnae TaxID=5949 RepID=G9HPG0_STYLE|nr:RecQ-like protein [Stylonychia lemnae]
MTNASSGILTKQQFPNTAGLKANQNPILQKQQVGIPNISRKAVTSVDSRQPSKKQNQSMIPASKAVGKKKFNLDAMMYNPTDDLKIDNAATIFIEREKQHKVEKSYEEPSTAINEPEQNIENSIMQTFSRLNQRIASAQAKMAKNVPNKSNENANNNSENVSTFNDQTLKVPGYQSFHNADQLINTADHSDIKNTQKTLFNSNFGNSDSTNLMSSAQQSAQTRPSISNQMTTPSDNYQTSQFTLNILGESGKASAKNNQETPKQFNQNPSKLTKIQETDEEGNRMSILPSKKRPSIVPSTGKKAPSVKKAKVKSTKQTDKQENIEGNEEKKSNTIMDKMKTQVDKLKESKPISKNPSSTQQRTNFVKMNMNNYKPRMRGGAFQNKMMAKKKNYLKFNERMKKKLMIENAKHRDQVNAYGGLGKVGLDHQGGTKEMVDAEGNAIEDLVPGFSTSALKYVRKLKQLSEIDINEDDENLLIDDLEQMKADLEKIDEDIKEDIVEVSSDFDKPLYKIPSSDEEYQKILKERFGHETFKAGQLEAIKILLEKKQNALVVLATGGGKSLVYQYVSMFLQGLVLIVTPLISLMTDQLGKLPDFLPGASLNSQQNYQLKKEVIKAIQDKHIKILFISPEKFFIEDFSKYNRKIAMVCVDEIHCASEWSHNFRPAYLKLHDMIKEKVSNQQDNCVVMGLTATATKATQRSVCKIFDVKYPDHIVTEANLSRMNLSLSITRDQDKLKSLLALLASNSFKKLTSILIFATHKGTCERLASHLNQNGINSSAYHAGKTDQQRQMIQKNFINNNIRVLVCTIAFSMGIDKSDIQSVIHYDMPKSIENYVQEIGRAGRDGKLARCHLFLCNEDFYLIRRLILTDILDNQNALKLTNKIVVEFKKTLLKIINPTLAKSKKRKLKSISGAEEKHDQLIEEFEHEEEIKNYYEGSENDAKKIYPSSIKQIENPDRVYLFLDIKDTLEMLDLKKEVVLTMLNSLEKLTDEKKFFRLEGILPEKIGLRFHNKRPEQMAKDNSFIRKFMEIAKEHQGVYNVSTQRLAYELNMNPFQIPKILFSLQNTEHGDISYDTDQDSFVLRLQHIPSGGSTFDLSQDMLTETRRIERNMIQKLNCMYFVARKVSLLLQSICLKKRSKKIPWICTKLIHNN